MNGEEAQRQAERNLIALAYTHAESEELDRSIGWTVVCTDLQSHAVSVIGIWPKDALADAMKYAIEMQEGVNRGIEPPEQGWRVEVSPIAPAD